MQTTSPLLVSHLCQWECANPSGHFRKSRGSLVPGNETSLIEEDAMAHRKDWNQKIIEELRANEVRVGCPFERLPLLLLHHRGARSGIERVNPLAYQQVGDALAVFGSKGGA